MKKPEPAKKRIQRFLLKQTKGEAKGWSYEDAPDPRQQVKVDHSMPSVLWSLELGLTSNQPTLRDVEEMTEQPGQVIRRLVPDRISDTTLGTELQRMDPAYLHEKLIQRIRGFHRSKMLQPEGLPCGVVAVDGKNLATLDHDADGAGHKRSTENEKWHLPKDEEKQRGKEYFLMPVLRATLCSAEAKPCIYQLPLPPGIGESTVFPAMVAGLVVAYGHSDMFRIIEADAGLTSLANAGVVIGAGYDYAFGLKGNQAELFGEAKALLLPMAETREPERRTSWEVRNGNRIRRSLWRTGEMAGMENSVGAWTHLRQTWLVRQETRNPVGKIEVEDRFFISSLTWDYLSAAQILLLVRGHWAVENDCFNSLDLQWREDSGPWCTQGAAIHVLGVLRIMGYNTAQMLRRRCLRKRRPDGTRDAPMSWRSLFKAIERAFEIEADLLFCTG